MFSLLNTLFSGNMKGSKKHNLNEILNDHLNLEELSFVSQPVPPILQEELSSLAIN